MTLTKDQLLAIMPKCPSDKVQLYCDSINAHAQEYGITTPLRMAHFLGQVAHESCQLTTLSENLNYSLKGLRTVFPKYFKTDAIAAPYARKPMAIANRVYAQRLGNGTEASGDGWKYRGRGAIQVTGKAQYQEYKKATLVNVVLYPDLLSEPENAIRSAMWWWSNNKCNTLADLDNVLNVTKRVNGGTNGLAEREAYTRKAKQILK